jgi:UDP-4-amino-4,6-dideoxy-N-acetyl-beta-L-altrosamine N-acetyltransferase
MAHHLRLLREDDLPTVMRWRMSPEITRHMYTDPQLTLEGQRAWFARIRASAQDRVWIIESLPEGAAPQPVGLLSLSEIDHHHGRCSWAYYLGEESARGMGLAKALELSLCEYVFETLGLNKLCCEVLASNDRVVALHEKFGSRREGLLREHIFKHGAWHDVVRMGLLRSEWFLVRERFSWTAIPIETLSGTGTPSPQPSPASGKGSSVAESGNGACIAPAPPAPGERVGVRGQPEQPALAPAIAAF